MRYIGLEFSVDELKSFREGVAGTPTAKMLDEVIAKIRNDAKIDLQRPAMTLDEMRNRQGVIEGMNKFKDIVLELLKFDVEKLLATEVEPEAEEEDEDAPIFNW